MPDTVLILGARGRFGRHAAAAFAEAGWTVRGLTRGAPAENVHETVTADAADPDAVTRAAEGASVIVQAVNPPYPDWARDLPRFNAALIAAARAAGATVFLPGNVYAYGASMPEVLTEAAPLRPDTRKGRLRAGLEAALRAETAFQTLVIRAGDFLDDRASGNWFDLQIAPPVAKGRVVYPGPLDAVHAWAWLPDLARAAAALAGKRAELPRWAAYGLEGFSLTGAELIAAMSRAAGRELRPKGFPWPLIRLAGLVWPLGRELAEMRYLWSTPHRIDGAALAEVLPGFVPTPLDEAMPKALAPLL
ncbi:MAG: NAD(P)H-binding protein [Pseudomonadota bacterium]